MTTILYLHGFSSSGNSGTPQMLRQLLYAEGVRVLSPDIPVQPAEAMPFLRAYVEEHRPDLIIGSSMGAFYTEQLRGYRRILVNPSFQMSRLLTFRGTGRIAFQNKREDGAKDFKVDRAMIDQFRDIERHSFKDITPADKAIVWGFFGEHDDTVNHQKDFLRHYDKAHFHTFDGGHGLTDRILSRDIVPLVRQILGL